ncbi:hypothetical protein [Longimicrobium sp.]|jgi:hypothetical protein|uniref:hypothetical protein n=1 Tax=Longimicrobium sp. TaxID=2029185 RepID=UPI002F9405D7
MPFLAANGLTLDMVSLRQRERVTRGELVRAFDNTLLDGRDAGRREWEGDTRPLTSAEAAAYVAALAGDVPLTGDALVSPATVNVTVRDRSFERVKNGFEVVLSLTFQEV